MKVAYLAKMANLQLATNMANIHQIRNKIFNEMAKRRFESSDFDENGDVDQNSEKPPKPYLQVKWGGKESPPPKKSGEYGEKSQRRFWRRWQNLPKKWLKFAKGLYRSNEIDELGENGQRVNLSKKLPEGWRKFKWGYNWGTPRKVAKLTKMENLTKMGNLASIFHEVAKYSN